MNHSAQNAQQRTTHGAAPKPPASVTRLPTRQAGNSLPQRAEGLALQLASRLSADIASSGARAAHGHFMNGFLAALEATGIVGAQRLTVLRHACDTLLDGNLTLQDLKAMKASGNGNATDPTYLRAVSLVRRHGSGDVGRLADALAIGKTPAGELLDRMQADGILNLPDLFGVRTLASAEVSHG